MKPATTPHRVRDCVTLAVFGAVWLAVEIHAQDLPSARSAAPTSATPASASVTRLRSESEMVLAASPPASLLRIGQALVLLTPSGASAINADGTVRAIARGADLQSASVTSDARFAYAVGGLLSHQPSAELWRIDLGDRGLDWHRLSPLPGPCSNAVLVAQGDELLVAGRTIAGAAFLDRVHKADGAMERLTPPPQFERALSLGAQSSALYLAGVDGSGAQRFWRRKEGRWMAACRPPDELLALSPIPIGQSHLLYATTNNQTPVLLYHTVTDTWIPIPAEGGATLAVAEREGHIVRLVAHEGGGLALRTETLLHPKRGLGLFDYAMLAGYFGLNLGIGFLCAKRKATSDDFFRGGGRLQWWALGISYMATGMSSISFMAYPATAYGGNWLLIGVPLFQSAAVVVAAVLFIRMFRRLNVTTVFEYLEQRFGRGIRWLGAVLMILGQVGGRLSIVMLLPAMAFSAVTGLNVYLSVLLMGVVTVIYCLKGGMKAVVWTDVLQFALMFGAVALALAIVVHHVPGGFGGLLLVARDEGKFTSFRFDWSFVQPTVWVFCCLAVTTVFLQLSDQALMQRALSAPDEKAARNSVMLAGVLNFPMSLMLFFIGSALFVYYRYHPALLDPALPNDSMFPFFVGTELPHGMVGLIIAGIFAAAMSTVSGTVNAISAIMVRDFLLPFRPDSDEAGRMKLARGTTVVVGGLATIIAAVMAGMNIRSLWETFAALIALIGGGFPGIFALGLLTRRANAPGVAIGLAASIAVTFAVQHYTAANVFLFTSVAVGSCMGIGYAASLCFAAPAQSLQGLTIYDESTARNVPQRDSAQAV